MKENQRKPEKSTEKNLKFANFIKFFQLTKVSDYMIRINNRTLTHATQPYFNDIVPSSQNWMGIILLSTGYAKRNKEEQTRQISILWMSVGQND